MVKYKLKFGNPPPKVDKSTYHQLVGSYGDIMRGISYNKWETVDEILTKVWKIESKMKHPSGRTRKQVTDALETLAKCSLVETLDIAKTTA